MSLTSLHRILAVFALASFAILVPALAEEPGRPQTPPVSAELAGWIDACVSGLGSPDEIVRSSASTALAGIGEPARVALEAVVRAGVEPARTRAERLVTQLDRRRRASRATPRPAPAERRSDAQRRLLLDSLALDEGRRKTWDRLHAEHDAARSDIVKHARTGELAREQAGPRLEELRQGLVRDVRAMLTPEQRKLYDEKTASPVAGSR